LQTIAKERRAQLIRHGPLQEEIAMLVLSRKSGEEIRIGDNIVDSVIRTQGQRVMLGIVTPRNIAIRRQELLAEIQNKSFVKK
jgi:carbon storage regulator